MIVSMFVFVVVDLCKPHLLDGVSILASLHVAEHAFFSHTIA